MAQKEIRAPFAFEAPLLDRDVQMQRNQKVLVEPPILRKTAPGSTQRGDARMELLLDALAFALADTVTSLEEKTGLLALQYPNVRRDEIPWLLATDEPDSLVDRLNRAWAQVMGIGVADMLPVGNYDRVVVLTAQTESLMRRNEIILQTNLEQKLALILNNLGMNPEETAHAASVLRPFVSTNLIYDADETRRRQDLARESVPTVMTFQYDQRIIDDGVLVSEQHALYLDKLKDLLRDLGGSDDRTGRASRYIVRGLLIAVALALYGWLALIHFPDTLRRLRFLLALAVVVAVFLVGASFALGRPALGPMAVPLILLSLFATVLFKDRVGYTTTLLGVTLLAILPGTGARQYIHLVHPGHGHGDLGPPGAEAQPVLPDHAVADLPVGGPGVPAGPGRLRPGQGGEHLYLVGLFAPVLLVAFGLFLLPVIEPLVGVCSRSDPAGTFGPEPPPVETDGTGIPGNLPPQPGGGAAGRARGAGHRRQRPA